MDNEARQNQDLDTLNQAINALVTETGIQIKVQKTEVRVEEMENFQADALIAIGPEKQDVYVEIKRHAQHINLGAIINQVKRIPGKAILVADYINPNMAEKLKNENIQYIDTVGNAFINVTPLYILITGRKQNKELAINTQTHTSRAFEPKGLMVTYGILTNPNLLNLPYRDIAAATDVARGTVGWVINALKAGNYIHDTVKRKDRRITDYQRLLDRWVEAWPEKLRPKQFLGMFVADEPHWWQNIDIQDYDGYWGGETAGALYNGYLKPQVTTVYIPKNKHAKLIRDARLVKATRNDRGIDGNRVFLYTPFWPTAKPGNVGKEDDIEDTMQLDDRNTATRIHEDPGLVNPVLAYADLIATGDVRNIEVATKLYDNRIARLDR